jgi:hypothetical protein
MLNAQDRNIDETFEHALVCRLRDIRIWLHGIQDNHPAAEARSADCFFRKPYMVQDPKAICGNDYDLQLQVTREIAIVVVRPDRDGNPSCAFDEHMCMALREMGKSLPQRVEIGLAFFDERSCVRCDRSMVPNRVDHELRLATVARLEKLLYIQVVTGADRFHADRVNSPGSGEPNQAAGHERLSGASVCACDEIIQPNTKVEKSCSYSYAWMFLGSQCKNKIIAEPSDLSSTQKPKLPVCWYLYNRPPFISCAS